MQLYRQTRVALATSLIALAAGSALAQDITLKNPDTGIEVSGRFVGINNGVFTVATDTGNRTINTADVDCIGAACPNETVSLVSIEGELSATGEFQRFENGLYYVDTDYGVLNVPANGTLCEGEPCRADYEAASGFVVASADSLSADLVPALRQGFTSVTATLPRRVEVVSSDTVGVLQSLFGQEANLAITPRRVNAEETDLFAQSPVGDVTRTGQETVVALDALLFVVSPDNPLNTLGQDQLADIFSGRITDWAQLGGDPGPINLYVPAEGTGGADGFEELVMSPANARTSRATTLDSEVEVTEAVARDINGIGVTTYSARGDAKSLDVRTQCGIQMPASEFAIKSEEYPFVRRVYMYQPGTGVANLDQDFVDFVASEEGQNIVAGTSFVDQSVGYASVNEQGLRFLSAVRPSDAEGSFEDIRAMMRDMESAERLSLTFRFDLGSSRLDARANGDLVRLAEMLNSGDFRNKEVVLIGFTDSIGSQEQNLRLSDERAAEVRASLLRLADANRVDDLRVKHAGYGELSPLGCNDSDLGRGINRRVEVWVRDIVRNGA